MHPLDSASPETVDEMCPAGTETAGTGFNTRGAGNVLADPTPLWCTASLKSCPARASPAGHRQDPAGRGRGQGRRTLTA